MVGRGDLDQGGPGRRQDPRRVDDPRHARDRPAHIGHRAVLRPSQDGGAHPGPHRRGVQQDLRHRPPDGAVGEQPRRPAEPGQRAPARPRCGLLRGGRLGATVLVRCQRAPARRVRAPGHAAPRGMGIALVVAHRQRGAPRDARTRRDGRPRGVRDLRRDRTGRHGLSPGPRREPGGRARRTGRLHAAAQRGGRHRRRPHDHAAGPRPLPRRDRRRHGDARQEVVRGPSPRGRVRAAPRRDVGLVHARRLGPAGARPRRRGDGRRRLERRLPVRDVPHDRDRERPRARLADLVRRRARVGDLRADGTGRAPVGHAVGRGAAVRRRPGRDRRLRHDRPAREGLPRPRQRAGAGLRPRRGGDGPPQGQGRRLRGQGDVPGAAVPPAGRGPLHADRGRSEVGDRASPDTCSARSRSSRPTAVRSSTARAGGRM